MLEPLPPHAMAVRCRWRSDFQIVGNETQEEEDDELIEAWNKITLPEDVRTQHSARLRGLRGNRGIAKNQTVLGILQWWGAGVRSLCRILSRLTHVPNRRCCAKNIYVYSQNIIYKYKHKLYIYVYTYIYIYIYIYIYEVYFIFSLTSLNFTLLLSHELWYAPYPTRQAA